MRDPERIDRIVEKLHGLWHEYSDLRLCQLVENIVVAVPKRGHCIYYVEDDRFEERLDAWVKRLEERDE